MYVALKQSRAFLILSFLLFLCLFCFVFTAMDSEPEGQGGIRTSKGLKAREGSQEREILHLHLMLPNIDWILAVIWETSGTQLS